MEEEATAAPPAGSVMEAEPTGVDLTDLVTELGVDTSVYEGMVDAADEFYNQATTIELHDGQETWTSASIGDRIFEVVYTYRGGSLRRISRLRHHIAADDRDSLVLTGVIRPARLDVELVIEGKGRVPLTEYLRGLLNAARARKEKPPVSFEQFPSLLARLGMPLLDVPEMGISGGMNLQWQHFGCDEPVALEFLVKVQECGWVPAPPPPRTDGTEGKVEEAYKVPDGQESTIAVLGFDLTKSNPKRTQHYGRRIKMSDDDDGITYLGHGFDNFVESIIDNFNRSIGNRQARKPLKVQLAAMEAEGADPEDLRAQAERIREISDMATSWMNNYAGGQRGVFEVGDTTLRWENNYYPGQANLGKIWYAIDGGEPILLDLWKERSADSTAPATGGTATVVDTVLDDDDLDLDPLDPAEVEGNKF